MCRFLLTVFLASVLATGICFGEAKATLLTIGTGDISGVGTGYNLIYDNDSPFGPIVWLDYNSGYDYWWRQVYVADSFNKTGTLNYHLNPGITVTWNGDWRLPSTVDGKWTYGYDGTTTAGYNITTSEMGHLFYTELGNKGYVATDGITPQPGWGMTNTGPFTSLLSNCWYWSGTVYSAYTPDAWHFATDYFYQGTESVEYSTGYALAVRPGQVESAGVPEPSTLLLVGGGLAGLALLRRKARN